MNRQAFAVQVAIVHDLSVFVIEVILVELFIGPDSGDWHHTSRETSTVPHEGIFNHHAKVFHVSDLWRCHWPKRRDKSCQTLILPPLTHFINELISVLVEISHLFFSHDSHTAHLYS